MPSPTEEIKKISPSEIYAELRLQYQTGFIRFSTLIKEKLLCRCAFLFLYQQNTINTIKSILREIKGNFFKQFFAIL